MSNGVKKIRSSCMKTRLKRKARARGRITGTAEKPRFSIFRSNTHIYAQMIDDTKGHTLVAASTRDEAFKGKSHKDKEAAKFVGAAIAKKAQEKGISGCVFDRNGFLYHGKIKLLADSAREAGLKF